MAYLENGVEVEVVQRTDAGIVVRPWMESSEEKWLGKPRIVDHVYDSEPVEKRSERVAALEQQIAELMSKKIELAAEERTYAERRKKLASLPSLELLEDVLEGRITHYLLIPDFGDFRIMKVSESRPEGDGFRCDRELRLLSLMGKPGGHPWWKLNKYSDGSGGYEVCHPTTSYESAVEKLQAICDELTEAARTKSHIRGRLIKAASTYGIVVADELRQIEHHLRHQTAIKAVEDAKSFLEKKEAELMSLEANAQGVEKAEVM